ncbi:MAG: hypothetical protein AAF828_08550, partial [Bacteroidota bacterium]
RKGYNTIEVARTSVMPYAITLRLGAHRLYNLYEVSGFRRNIQNIGAEGTSRQTVWAVGYGIGWANRLDQRGRQRWHTEIVGTHINRGSGWESRLNFVLSTRFTYDWGPANGTHFFIGPVMNLHWTKLSEEELDNLFVSGWKLFQSEYDEVKFRGILGIRFGMRIGKN